MKVGETVTMPKRRNLLAVAGLAAVLAMPAMAQVPQAGPPMHVRGTVAALDGNTLTVAAADGKQVTVALAPGYKVRAVVAKTLADIKDGDFVASTSVKGTDGKLHAVEVHILPNAQRGVAREGQFPWDLQPGSLMTNATAAGIATAPQGQVLHVTWKDGAADVVVAPGTPIVGYVNGDPSLLKPGAAVFILARKGADGTLTTAAVTAEKDGVKPPM
jgi:hypothetical protein